MAARKLNVGMIGYKFMGKAHSNAWLKVAKFFDVKAEPVMKVICGRNVEGARGMQKFGWQSVCPDWREVVEWFVQAGRGLCAAHEAGMVHRDFKPENVLVGDDGRARVVDFGLAHVLHDRAQEDVAGTPHYMAPEVRAGRPATPASDQFGFCVALRDAITGKDVPAHLESAIDRGIRDDPAQRHATLGVLVDVLAAALTKAGGERPRALLLDRVERLWLRGVLDQIGRAHV